MALIHSNAPALVEQLRGRLDGALACPPDVVVAELTPGLSVHTGAGLAGVVLVLRSQQG
jgi:hypothetical protein